MVPSQFKRLISTLHTQLGAIQEAVNKQTDSAREDNSSQREQGRNIVGSLGVIADSIKSEDQKGDSAYEKSYGQQERSIRVQKRLGTWAAAAFFAAFGSLVGVLWQGCLMLKTYSQIKKQTTAAEQAAYNSCLSTQAAQQSLIDSHASAVAAIQQARWAVEDQKPIIEINDQSPHMDILSDGTAALPYTYKNVGKGTAATFSLYYRAVLLKTNEILKIREDPPIMGKNTLFAPGDEHPRQPKGKDPIEQPLSLLVPLEDSKGKRVPALSQEAATFFKGGDPPIEGFRYGRMEYTDTFGSHIEHFCFSVMMFRLDRPHQVNENEKTCTSYNRREDIYPTLPKVPVLPKATGEPAKCTASTD